MSIKKGLAAMFGFASRTDERPAPDPIKADLTRATQANERAGENARQALEELLKRNDDLKGSRQ